jgi:hypothetical protein
LVIKKTLPKLLHGTSTVIAVLAIMLGSRTARATTWVEGATQFAPTNQYFTAVAAEFVVPSVPQECSTPVSIWSGVESSTYVLQTVLTCGLTDGVTNGGEAGWAIQNEVDQNASWPPSFGQPVSVQVSPGDLILWEVWMDNSSPQPSGCNGLTGAGCNYWVGWADLNPNNTSQLKPGMNPATLSKEFLLPESPYWAQGLILEDPTGGEYDSCTALPFQTGITAGVALYTFTWAGGLYTPLATDLTLNLPKNWFNPTLTNGQSAYTACGWTLGVGSFSSTEGEVFMDFAQ